MAIASTPSAGAFAYSSVADQRHTLVCLQFQVHRQQLACNMSALQASKPNVCAHTKRGYRAGAPVPSRRGSISISKRVQHLQQVDPAAASQQHRRRRSVTVNAAKSKAAAAATATVASTPLFPAIQQVVTPIAPYILAAAAAYCSVNILLMALLPRWRVTQSLCRSSLPYVLLAVGYAALLLASWQTDTLHLMMPGSLEAGLAGGFNPQFFPHLSEIKLLFNRGGLTAASFLAHVLAINLFSARALYMDSLHARSVPVFHSILLCVLLGPLGIVAHLATKLVYWALGTATGRDLRPASPPVVEKGKDGGVITIMPYE